jgi:uncharacterized membrane protein YdbT with pleckstrin-like domain
MEEEKTIYVTSPSQIVNLKHYLFSLIVIAGLVTAFVFFHERVLLYLIALPLIYALVKYLQVKATRFTLTDQRIILCEGFFNKVTNETELYRVRDTSILEPFFFRMFKLGNISVYTTDEADTTLHLKAYHKPHWVKDQIRNYSEVCRRNKRWGNDNVMIQEHQV